MGFEVEGLDFDGEGDLLLLFQLIFGLRHLLVSIIAFTRNCFLGASLLSVQHLLSFSFGFFEPLLFLLSFNSLLIGFLLLLVKLLFLLSSDLLPLSLLLLQLLQLLLLL